MIELVEDRLFKNIHLSTETGRFSALKETLSRENYRQSKQGLETAVSSAVMYKGEYNTIMKHVLPFKGYWINRALAGDS